MEASTQEIMYVYMFSSKPMPFSCLTMAKTDIIRAQIFERKRSTLLPRCLPSFLPQKCNVSLSAYNTASAWIDQEITVKSRRSKAISIITESKFIHYSFEAFKLLHIRNHEPNKSCAAHLGFLSYQVANAPVR